MKPVVSKVGHATVAETVARIIAELEARGMKLLTTIDHSGEARAAGLELRETKPVIFGNPRTGTPIMQAAPLAGLDLPLKVPVRADAGRTCVSYTAPAGWMTGNPAGRRSACRTTPALAGGGGRLVDESMAPSREPHT